MSQKLEELRNTIDTIDSTIIDLLSKRFELAKDIAIFKKQHNKTIFDEAREKEILASKTKQAQQKNISPDFVEKLFTDIMQESRNIQNNS